ncbi:MAG TPA: hypothetical protein VNL35_00265 [Chloroflexota bacterium]|nr:hypothetical protein [Chloroflexota bacterium]
MLTLFGAGAVTMMLIAYSLESRAVAWVLVFALACAASSAYGWFAGTWPFGVVEGIWAIVAARRWFIRKARGCEPVPRMPATLGHARRWGSG